MTENSAPNSPAPNSDEENHAIAAASPVDDDDFVEVGHLVLVHDDDERQPSTPR